jgi:hypothetical protein
MGNSVVWYLGTGGTDQGRSWGQDAAFVKIFFSTIE